jgi:hypothetical protein
MGIAGIVVWFETKNNLTFTNERYAVLNKV